MAVERAQSGDNDGICFLYERFAPEVHRYVRSIVNDHHEAEDITQSVFTKLSTAIRRYEPQDVSFSAWILRVARNAALDHLRSRRPIPCETIRVEDQDCVWSRRERVRDISNALAHLPTEQRHVLILRHVSGLTPREIATASGKTESSVHGLHHRGRVALVAELQRLGAAPVVSPQVPA